MIVAYKEDRSSQFPLRTEIISLPVIVLFENISFFFFLKLKATSMPESVAGSQEPAVSLKPACLCAPPPGVGDRPQRPLLVAAQEDRGQRRRLARSAARGLDRRVVARAVHELPGVLQRRGAGRPSAGPVPATGLPPQRFPRTRDGPGVAQGGTIVRRGKDANPASQKISSGINCLFLIHRPT